MDINFIITCYNRENYWIYLKKIIDNYKIIKPHIVLCYSGIDPNFPADIRIGNKNGIQTDFDLTIVGYDYSAKNGVYRFLKLGIDSWFIDENTIIKIFNDMENDKAIYAGSYWFYHCKSSLSTDIFFADTRFGNVFELLKEKYGYELPSAFEFCMYEVCKNYQHIIIGDREIEEIKRGGDRSYTDGLKLTMSHNLDENIKTANGYLEQVIADFRL